jgi:hypothetical protein
MVFLHFANPLKALREKYPYIEWAMDTPISKNGIMIMGSVRFKDIKEFNPMLGADGFELLVKVMVEELKRGIIKQAWEFLFEEEKRPETLYGMPILVSNLLPMDTIMIVMHPDRYFKTMENKPRP